MNLVTPRQRKEWLSKAEDYADIVHEKSAFLIIFNIRFISSFFKKQNMFYHMLQDFV